VKNDLLLPSNIQTHGDQTAAIGQMKCSMIQAAGTPDTILYPYGDPIVPEFPIAASIDFICCS
jgi:hypothetical protein